MIERLLQRLAPVWRALVLIVTVPLMAAAADDLGIGGRGWYEFVTINGRDVAWAPPELGAPLTIRYALVEGAVTRSGARNCASMVPPGAAIDTAALLADMREAMAAWEAGTNVRFVAARDAASADLLIGMQGEPRGIAYTDLEVEPHTSDDRRGLVTRSAICFNPLLDWELTTFDGDPATPNAFYVALHELGHVLGLNHVADDRSIMTFRNLEHLRAPLPEDLAGVQALYGLPRVTAAFP